MNPSWIAHAARVGAAIATAACSLALAQQQPASATNESAPPSLAALAQPASQSATPPPTTPARAPSSSSARPLASALRVETAPRIDGRLDDACWARAQPIGAFTQVEPVVGAQPIAPTDVRIVYTADALYVGVRCFDAEPSKILARQLERDANLDPDDRVEILIDTFLDRRNAFWFQMNPRGDLGDALVSNNGQDFNKPWDGIWDGRASIDELGYCLEFALPFKTLNFREGLSTWGLNVRRFDKRHEEESRWANASQDEGFFEIASAGDLVGLHDMRQGVGLDVTPFFVARWRNDLETDDEDVLGDPGVDAVYKITPSLNALLTINTDFADTEVDARQINLTRFPLFFPEKRDFFLQDAGLFKFADLGPGFGGGNVDLIPFFSRRIGIDTQGETVPLIAGGKLTGRAGPWNIGLLDVRTGEGSEVDGQNLGVARVTRNVGEQSTLGAIVTSGDPNSDDSNQLYGIDANYGTSSFLGDRVLRMSAWLLGTTTEGTHGDDHAYGASVRYPNDEWSWSAAFKEIQENFRPALGFVPRTAIRKYDASLTWAPRPHTWIRQWEFFVAPTVITGVDDDVQSSRIELQPFGLTLESGDWFALTIQREREVLESDFEIHDGVAIASGDYEWTRARIETSSADSRDWIVGSSFSGGDFYDGTRESFATDLTWRPSAHFNASLGYEQNHIDLEGGAFTTRLVQTRLNFTFSPTLSWSTFVQWDNESDSFGLNSRWRWIVEPGRELRAVLNHAWEQEDDHSITPSFQELAIKLEYTLRF